MVASTLQVLNMMILQTVHRKMNNMVHNMEDMVILMTTMEAEVLLAGDPWDL